MSAPHKSLKRYLEDLAGLRFGPGPLFETPGASLVFVVVRMTQVHASRTPYERLDEDMVHNKCLEIMENCHAKRDMLLGRHRMEDQFWEEIRLTTSWTELVPAHILRTFSLKLTHAAFAHFHDPKVNSRGEPRPSCALAVAALRFAKDIYAYEGYMWDQEDHPWRTSFTAYRAPTYFGNCKPVLDRQGNHVTQPVFPLSALGGAASARRMSIIGPSSLYKRTEEDPEWFSSIKRV